MTWDLDSPAEVWRENEQSTYRTILDFVPFSVAPQVLTVNTGLGPVNALIDQEHQAAVARLNLTDSTMRPGSATPGKSLHHEYVTQVRQQAPFVRWLLRDMDRDHDFWGRVLAELGDEVLGEGFDGPLDAGFGWRASFLVSRRDAEYFHRDPVPHFHGNADAWIGIRRSLDDVTAHVQSIVFGTLERNLVELDIGEHYRIPPPYHWRKSAGLVRDRLGFQGTLSDLSLMVREELFHDLPQVTDPGAW